MTRPATPNPAAAPPAAPASPPDPPAGGVAAWPQFVPLRIEAEYELPKVTFACAACREFGAVDDSTGLDRACWRVFSLLGQVLRDIRDKETT